MIYTNCTMKDVVEDVFDTIRPTEQDKEEVLAALEDKAPRRMVSRREADVIYSAAIWAEDTNGIQVAYYTDYL